MNLSTFSVIISFILIIIEYCETKRMAISKNYCKEHDLCENVKEYPLQQIETLLNLKKNKFNALKGSVLEPAKIKQPRKFNEKKKHKMMARINLKQFGSFEVDDENVCRTKKITVLPKHGIGRTGNVVIVNTSTFQQTVVYETCVDRERSCFPNEELPLGVKTICRQSYTWVRLLTMGKKKLIYQPVRVPSTCSCAYKYKP